MRRPYERGQTPEGRMTLRRGAKDCSLRPPERRPFSVGATGRSPLHRWVIRGPGRLPAQVAVEGDLVFGAALRGAFALHAQVAPDTNARPRVVLFSPRTPAVGTLATDMQS